MKIGLVIGTRPDALKMVPIYLKMKEKKINVKTIMTYQHKQMLNQVIDLFKISVDYNLNVMTENQSLTSLNNRINKEFDLLLRKEKFDVILVHGDTTTCFAAALIAFYNKIPIAHVEAGLRTKDIYEPFPEEMNRRLTAVLSSDHFAPTQNSYINLLKEGINEKNIIITGNTIIDLLYLIKEKKYSSNILNKLNINKQKYILMTAHRRENLDNNFKLMFKTIKQYLYMFPDETIVYPVHLNPKLRDIVFKFFSEIQNIKLIDPLNYIDFITLMDNSKYIITDSGGIQEEAISLRKPLVILRNKTEREEILKLKNIFIVGNNSELLSKILLFLKEKNNILIEKNDIFGKGNSSDIICNYIINKYGGDNNK